MLTISTMFIIDAVLLGLIALLLLLAIVGIKFSHNQLHWSNHAGRSAIAQYKELVKSLNSSRQGSFASLMCNALKPAKLVVFTRTARKANSGVTDGSIVRSETAGFTFSL